jgi:hypothetical protein
LPAQELDERTHHDHCPTSDVRPSPVDAHEASTTDEVSELLVAGISDRERALINMRTTPVDA